MPRSKKLSRAGGIQPRATAFPELRANAVVVDPKTLKRTMYGRPTQQDQWGRQRYGRSLTLDRIERALRSAQNGFMKDLTDMSRETIGVDPHLSAVLSKRISAAASVPYQVVPATGPGTDPALAQKYADFVREQIEAIPRWKQAMKQLAWGLFDGRAALETQWVTRADVGVGRVGGQWRVAELTWIHPRRLQFGPDRELRLQDDYTAGYSFAATGLALRDWYGKFIEFKPQLFGDYPEFEGLAPKCLYWSFFKRFGARERNVLLELFGKPWRIIEVADESEASDEDLLAAEIIADQIGNSTTARMPRGTKLELVQANANAGQIHADVIAESDRQLSKLVLGQTGTTDGLAGALGGGNQSLVMMNEQMLILQGDAELLAEAVEDGLTDVIIALNFGVDALVNAPRFLMQAEAQPDRKADTERMKLALDLGLSITVDEMYKLTGFTKPGQGDAVVKLVDQPNGLGGIVRVAQITAAEVEEADAAFDAADAATNNEDGTPVAPVATPPANDTDGALTLELTPSTIADIFTVNEGRKSQKAGPLLLPDGTPDPDGDLPINEFKAKRAAAAEAQGAAVGEVAGAVDAQNVPGAAEVKPAGGEGNSGSAAPAPGGGGTAPAAPAPPLDPATEAVKRAIGLERESIEQVSGELVVALMRHMAGNVTAVHKHDASCVLLAKQRQPESVHGTIEVLIERGVKESARVADRWVQQFVDSVRGLDKPSKINARLSAVAERLDTLPFARSIERRIVHSSMTGALDSQWEDQNETEITPTEFLEPASAQASRVHLAEVKGVLPSFTNMAYQEALRYFKLKTPVPKSIFEKLNAAAKARSFTVAGLASEHALNIAKSELGNAIAEGTAMASFAERLTARFKTAGFGSLNSSHLETVFRTNLVDSYNVGRKAEMSTPTALKERPYWVVRTVRDDRQRANHRAVDGWVLRASDPFWRQVGGPPWGFNCRCRLSTIRESKLAGRVVRSGVEIRGIPDEGFEPGALWSDSE